MFGYKCQQTVIGLIADSGLGYWRLLLTSTALALVILLVGGPVEQAKERFFKKRDAAPPQ
jgi:hypothetical protein